MRGWYGRKLLIEYDMAKLVDLAWCREVHLGLDFNEEPMEGNDVNDQPTPLVKLPKACEFAQLLFDGPSERKTRGLLILHSQIVMQTYL